MSRANRHHLPAALALAMVAAACTQQAPTAPAPPAPAAASPLAEPANAPAASSEALAWIEGDWCGGGDGEQIQENWTTPVVNEAIGMSRTVRGGRMNSFEFMRIVDRDGTLTYVAQPNGEPATYFKRSDGGEGWIRFENKEHDFPQRIEYRKDGEGLLAQIAGPGEADKEEVISYRYRRCGK